MEAGAWNETKIPRPIKPQMTGVIWTLKGEAGKGKVCFAPLNAQNFNFGQGRSRRASFYRSGNFSLVPNPQQLWHRNCGVARRWFI